MILVLLAAAAAQPQVESARAFMEQLYTSYRKSDYSPFTHPERVFAPRLLAAINEDAKMAHGELGYLDGDPVCQCQDQAGMHPSIVRVTEQGPDKAIAQVTIRWDHDKRRPTRFSLVRTAVGWRIADVSSADEPSVLRALEQSNRKLRARH